MKFDKKRLRINILHKFDKHLNFQVLPICVANKKEWKSKKNATQTSEMTSESKGTEIIQKNAKANEKAIAE